ncbi:CapA family protein [Planococcus sp. YIM B11945]|uniref:CapA family protein n=1 Tax=Planococcus sp. YIM B11945 TaxID=3435410 RepID=UPI003D7E1180
MKQLKFTQLSYFLLLLISGSLLAGCGSQNATLAEEKAEDRFESRQAPVSLPTKKFVKTSTASLSAIGDVLIHTPLYKDAETKSGYDFNPMFANVKPYLEKSDITVANSESIIGGSEIGLSSYPSFNSPFEVGDAMKDAGIDVVSMANNHTLDRGEKAIENAIHHWDEIGIVHTGSALSKEDSARIATMTKNGITFSFLSYTYGTNGIAAPAGKEFLVNRIDKEKIKQDVAKAKSKSDVVVVSLHFGNEYEPLPTAEQKDLAHFTAEQGADIILGHHPHVLQPAEWIETADGRKSFVVYSLGNFLSGQNELDRQIGAILHLTVEKTTTADSTMIAIQDPSFTTTFVKHSGYRNFEIELLKNVNPPKNTLVKAHMSTWINNLTFDE